MPHYRQLQTQKVNLQHPLNKKLFSWHLNLPDRQWGGGLIFRDLMRRTDGTFAGGMGVSDWRGTDQPGGYGALNFDGSGDKVDVPIASTEAIGTQDYAFALWVTQTGGGTDEVAFGAIGSGNDTWIGTNGSGFVNFSISGGSNATSSVSIADSGPFHLMGTRISSEMFLYINGVQEAGPVSNSSDITATAYTIGAFSGAGFNWQDLINDVRFYIGRGIGVNEATALYKESRAGYPNALNWVNNVVALPPAVGAGDLLLTNRSIANYGGIRQ